MPGASAVLERGFVTYANRAKVEELGVDAALLASHGAVSAEVAAAMAAGARRAARADVGVGVTGIAGPDGGTPEKPVGLVFIATDGAAGTRVRRAVFPGARERVRHQATQVALEMIRRGLLGLAAAVTDETRPRLRRARARRSGLREAVGDLQARLRPRLGSVRLVRPEGAHLTLRFLGQTSPAQVDALRGPLAGAAARVPAVRGARRRTRHLPGAREPARSLARASSCPTPCSRCRRPASARPSPQASRRRSAPFKPHLTLGRWRERDRRPELPRVDLGSRAWTTLVLFRSELRAEGALYTPLARFPLGAAID